MQKHKQNKTRALLYYEILYGHLKGSRLISFYQHAQSSKTRLREKAMLFEGKYILTKFTRRYITELQLQ